MSQCLPAHLIETHVTPHLDVKNGLLLSMALGSCATAKYTRDNRREILLEKRKTQKDFIKGDIYCNSKDPGETWEISDVGADNVVFVCKASGRIRRFHKAWHACDSDNSFGRVLFGNGRLSGSLIQV